jgi:putative transposase
MEKAYRFRIYPNNEQKTFFAKQFGSCRYVYNRVLGMIEERYKSGKKSLSITEYMKLLPGWKKESPWLGAVDAVALQQSLRDLDRAYANFFRNPGHFRPPRFKRKSTEQSYRTNRVKIIDSRHVKLPKVGIVRCRVSREVEGRILSATIRMKSSGKYYISFCCTDVSVALMPEVEGAVGVDLGVASLATASDGSAWEPAKATYKYERKLAREQRRLSRKKKGSSNYGKQKRKVARVHEKISNTRRDRINKMTTALVRENQAVFAEDLKTKNMLRNRHLAKAVSDSSFGEILRQLEYKCEWYGRDFRKVDTWYPSSKLCSSCGYLSDSMPLSVREWTCPECDVTHDRDLNAAKNILAEGMRLLALDGTEGRSGTGEAKAS